MGGERKAPKARDRVIGARLRAIRKEQTNYSLVEAAELAQWSPSTMSRIETGKRHISPEDVATICTVYKLRLAQREELIEEARAGHSSGWWDQPLPGVPMDMGALASYESEAIRLTDWSVNLIPGLLQTYEYAVGVMRSGPIAPTDVELRWMARLRRQQVLGSLDYTAYIGESALRTPFGGKQALRAQLQHLIAARNRGIRIRVVPAHQPHLVMTHSWLLMEFAQTTPVVYVEAWNGSLYLHDDTAETYFSLLEQLAAASLSATASLDMLREIIEEL